jgi:predicted nucleic acid-binding protein
MATRVADLGAAPGRVMLDTNVLLSATDEGRAEHRNALTVLSDWPAARTELCLSGQVLREYLAVATRPASGNGLGLSMPDALENARAIRARTTLLAEDGAVADRLAVLLADIECTGKQVHDANLVATMLVHGVRAVVTMNLADFARFGRHVSLIGL